MKKQFVMIMCDTQRWDMLNCYRQTGLQTPHLDALAAGGVRYERAYAVQPVCGPARSAIFTGLMPSVNGAWANDMPLYANVRTLGQRLAKHGVHAAYIGKYHLDGSDYFGTGECPEGWDPEYFYDLRMFLEELSERERVLSRSALSMKFRPVRKEDTFGGKVTARAIDFMNRHREEDYFLAVSFDEPHHPFLCPPPFDHLYDGYEFPVTPNVLDTLEGKPDYQRVWSGKRRLADREKVRIVHPAYFGCHSYVDDLVGQLMRVIPETAAVLYTADHGDMLESHSLDSKGAVSYDEAVRIPLLFRHPGGERGRVYSRQPVSHLSISPTVMEYFNLPASPAFHAGSMLNTVLDVQAPYAEACCFMEFGRFCQGNDTNGGLQLIRAVTDGHWKLAVNLMSTDELYNLDADPYEMNNLIDSPAHIKERNRLHDALTGHMDACRDPFRGYCWEQRPWRADAPEASWPGHGFRRQRPYDGYEPRELDYATGLEISAYQRRIVQPEQFAGCGSLDELAEKMIATHREPKLSDGHKCGD